MMNSQTLRHSFSFALASFVFLALASTSHAAYYYHSPLEKDLRVGVQDTIELWVDMGDMEGLAFDAYVEYDSSMLDIVEIVDPDPDPDSFTIIPIPEKDPGRYMVFGFPPELGKILPRGKFHIATMHVKPRKVGTTTFRFTCTPGRTDDSNIMGNTPGANDIIDCSKNNGGNYTIKPGDIITTSTPTPPPVCSKSKVLGDYSCDGKIDLADFEEWRQDYILGKATLKEFEEFRTAFTSDGSSTY
jgi:hypothetical protein